VRFYKPKTLKLSRKPKYARSVRQAQPVKDGFDKYSVLLRPVATEKAMKKMDEENTMV
jgi:large subunit ribosomal protein L23Ae